MKTDGLFLEMAQPGWDVGVPRRVPPQDYGPGTDNDQNRANMRGVNRLISRRVIPDIICPLCGQFVESTCLCPGVLGYPVVPFCPSGEDRVAIAHYACTCGATPFYVAVDGWPSWGAGGRSRMESYKGAPEVPPAELAYRTAIMRIFHLAYLQRGETLDDGGEDA